jgi:hypothetical protein
MTAREKVSADCSRSTFATTSIKALESSFSFQLIDAKIREAKRLHASVPRESWLVLKCARHELRSGRRFVARLSVVRKAIQSALADLEQAIRKVRIAVVAMRSVTVNGTVSFLRDLRTYAQLRQSRKYDRLLACIRDHPSATAARILMYWM